MPTFEMPTPRKVSDAVVCDHWVALDREAADNDSLAARLTPPDALVRANMADAHAFDARIEAGILDRLVAAGGAVLDRNDFGDKAAPLAEQVRGLRSEGRRVAVRVGDDATGDAQPLTKAAVGAGADVVCQPHLATGGVRLTGRLLVGGLPLIAVDGNPLETSATMMLWPTSPPEQPSLRAARPSWREGTPKWRLAHELFLWVAALREAGLPAPLLGGVIGAAIDEVVWYPLGSPRYRNPEVGRRRRVTAAELAAYAAQRHRSALDGSVATAPARRSECGVCPAWARVCRPRLAAADDVSLVAGVGMTVQTKIRPRGIERRSDLAGLHWQTAAALVAEPGLPDLIDVARSGVVAGDAPLRTLVGFLDPPGRRRPAREDALRRIGVERVADVAALDETTAALGRLGAVPSGLPRSIDQARSQITGELLFARPEYDRAGEQVHGALPAKGGYTVDLGFGVGWDGRLRRSLPRRGTVALHTDMENDGDHIIGYGCAVEFRTAAQTRIFARRWFSAFDYPGVAPEVASAKALAAFWGWQKRLVAKASARYGPDQVRHLVYSGAEQRVFDAQAVLAEGLGEPTPSPDEVADAFAAHWVDVYDRIRRGLVLPSEDRRLKTLAERHAGFAWRDPEPSGANCVVWYRQARAAAAAGETAAARRLQRRVEEYNGDDCEGQASLVGWLHRKMEAAQPVRPAAELDAAFHP